MKIKTLLYVILLLKLNSITSNSSDEDKNEIRNIVICCFDKNMKPLGKTELKTLHFETSIRFIKNVITLDQKCSYSNIKIFTANTYLEHLHRGHKLNILNDEETLKKIWDKDGSNLWAIIQI